MAEPPNPTRSSPPVPLPLAPAGAGQDDGLPESDGGRTTGVVLDEVLTALRRHPYVIVAATSLAIVGAAAFISAEEPFYRATAVVQQTDPRRALTSGIEDAESVPDRTISPLSSLMQVLQSRSVVGQVVDAQALQVRRANRGGAVELGHITWVSPDARPDTIRVTFGADGILARRQGIVRRSAYGAEVDLGIVRFSVPSRPAVAGVTWVVRSREEAIDAVLRDIDVRQRPQTNIIDVSYTAPTPGMAQRVVNALVDTFQASNARAAQEQSHRRRIFLETQIAQTDSLLTAAQLALSTFRSRQEVFSSREMLQASQNDLISIDLRRAELEGDRRVYADLLTKLRSASREERLSAVGAVVTLPAIAANPVASQLQRQLARYQATRESLTVGTWSNSPTHPDVVRLDRLIESSESQLADAVESQILAVDARLASLRELGSRSAAAVRSLPDKQAMEMRLQQQVETMQRLVDGLRQEHQKARMAEAVGAGQVQIVDYAALPYEPMARLRALKLALGMLVGLVLGGVAAVLLERADTSLRRYEDLTRALHIPGLALVPRMDPARVQSGLRSLLPARPANEGVTRARAVEAYRLLRTNLMVSSAPAPLRSILVTSTAPEEGKTVTAVNLAAAYVREGMSVLLIDADLRRGRLPELLNVSPTDGLSQLLRGEGTVDGAIIATPYPGLHLLARGKPVPGATDLLRGAKMRALLRTLTERYDIVILDTAPVLAVADATILGALVDGVLMVVCAGRTDRNEARRAVRQLGAVGARVLGAVLNDPSGRVASYPKYYAYADRVSPPPAPASAVVGGREWPRWASARRRRG